MADRLESRLQALVAGTEFPPTPALADRVGAELRARPAVVPVAATRRRRRVLALAVALALLVPAAAVAAIPGARHAVLEWLGLRGVEVTRVSRTPRAGPSAGLDLGRPASLSRAGVSFTPLAPAALGRPAGVFVAGAPAGGRVSLTYRPTADLPAIAPEVGALVTEFRGTQRIEFIRKLLGPGTTVRQVRVDGGRGVYLSGAPHGFLFADANGQIRDEQVRLARDVLIWQRGPLILRLEARRPLGELLRIARSFW